MKNVLFAFCAVILLASCGVKQNVQVSANAPAQAVVAVSGHKPFSLREFFRQYQFNPADIYGDVFTNKSWN